MSLILAFDQALKTTGYSVWDNYKLNDYGHFTIDATQPIGDRLQDIEHQLYKFIEDVKPDKVFFEDIQAQQNKETYKKLAYVQAVYHLFLTDNKINYEVLSPSHWRKTITDAYGIKFGKSRAVQKQTAKDFVKEQWSIAATEDECDAICLGWAGILQNKKNKSAF